MVELVAILWGIITVIGPAGGTVHGDAAALSNQGSLSVAPPADAASFGRAGGPIDPPGMVYRLTHVSGAGTGAVNWSVTIATPGVDWILIDRSTTATGTLAEGETAAVVISVDASITAAFGAGVYQAVLEFTDLTNAVTTTRTVSLTIVAPAFETSESLVAAAAKQPGGPSYDFQAATFHTTNAEFAAFLNDARVNLDNERGQFMYFDVDSGDVYIHDRATGVVGTDGTGTLFYNATVNPDLFYDSGSSRYDVRGGREDDPVTGVSWYGAVKYANWLTIDQGMPPTERCYTEDTSANLDGWHPVTVSLTDWQSRDLSDTERQNLVAHFRGYRLPMDDGANNATVTSDLADAYNEWYKAAAWDDAARQNRLFGFGRDVLTPADANYRDNGDPMDNDVTPVGFFDGSVRAAAFVTNANDNGFALFDLCGNVFHWIQGRFSDNPNNIRFRTVRGGSWNDAAGSTNLLAASRNFAPSGFTDRQVGFRVVRTVPASIADVDNDGDADRDDLVALGVCLTGPGPSPPRSFVSGCVNLDRDEDADVDLRDVAALFRALPGG